MNFEEELEARRVQNFTAPDSVFAQGMSVLDEHAANIAEYEASERDDQSFLADESGGAPVVSGQEASDIKAVRHLVRNSIFHLEPFKAIEPPIQPTQGPGEVPRNPPEPEAVAGPNMGEMSDVPYPESPEASDIKAADAEIMTPGDSSGEPFKAIEPPIQPTQGPGEVPRNPPEPEAVADPNMGEMSDVPYPESPEAVANPEVVADAPQGYVAHVNTTEAALIAQGAGSEVPAWKRAFRAVGEATGMISEKDFNESHTWPSVAEGPASPFEEGHIFIEDTKEFALAQNAFQRMSADPNDVMALRDMQGAMAKIKAAGREDDFNAATRTENQQGVEAAANPVELLTLNVGGILKTGGVAMIKQLAPYILPATVGGMFVEELAIDQDTWYQALGVGVVGAVLTGHMAYNVAPRSIGLGKFEYANMRNAVGSWRRREFLKGVSETGPGPKGSIESKAALKRANKVLNAPLRVQEEVASSIRVKAEAIIAEAPELTMKVNMPSMSAALEVAASRVSVPAAANLASKKIEIAAKQIEHNLVTGNLEDEATIEVAEKIFAPTTDTATMRSENAKLFSSARDKIAKAKASLAETDLSPQTVQQAADNNNPFSVPDIAITSGVEKALERQVRSEWYGKYEAKNDTSRSPFSRDRKVTQDLDALWKAKTGLSHAPEEFAGDYVERFRAVVAQAEKVGRVSGKVGEIRQKVFDSLVEEYDAGIAQDLKFRLGQIDSQNMAMQKSEYVLGGTDADDAKFASPQSATSGIQHMTPEEIKGANLTRSPIDGANVNEQGQVYSWDMDKVPNPPSRYFFNDWVIESQLVRTDELGKLKFRSKVQQLPETPVGQVNTNTSAIFDYPKQETKTILAQKARRFYDSMTNPKVWVEQPKEPGEDFNRKVLPQAQKWKVPTKIWLKMEDRVPGQKPYREALRLPDERIDAVARWLGWDEHKLTPWFEPLKSGPDSFIPDPAASSISATSRRTKGSFQHSVEDLKYQLDAADAMDIQSPGYFERHQKGAQFFKELMDDPARMASMSSDAIEALRPSANYHKMSSARTVYGKQREAYLRKVLNTPRGERATWSKKFGYVRELERLVVTQDMLARDARRLRGGPQQGISQRMYLLAGDVIAGTNKYAEVAGLVRQELRLEGQKKALAAQVNQLGTDSHNVYVTPFDTWDNAVQNTAVREGVSYNEASRRMVDEVGGQKLSAWNERIEREQFLEDASYEGKSMADAEEEYDSILAERAEETLRLQDQDEMWAMVADGESTAHLDPAAQGRAGDVAGGSVGGDVIAPGTRPDQMAIDAKAASMPKIETEIPQMANLTAIEQKLLGDNVNAIEDVFMARAIGGKYVLSGPSTKAVINPFKLNTIDDVSGLVEVARTLGNTGINVERSIGFKPSPRLSENMARPMARAALDLDDVLRPAAQALLRDPDNVIKAVAFEKFRSAQGVLLDALKTGRMGSESKKALATTDLLAADDRGIMSKLAKVIDDNYAMYGVEADTRMSVTLADMYDSHFTKAERLGWNSKIVETMESTGYIGEHHKSIETRKALNNMLKEACD